MNLDVVAHRYATRKGAFWIRVVDPSVQQDRVVLGRGFIRAQSTKGRPGHARPGTAGGNVAPQTGTVDIPRFFVDPAVMFAETTKHMHAEYRVSSSSISSVKASVGVSAEGFGVSGSMAIAKSGTYWRVGQLLASKKHPRRARLIKPRLSVDSKYVCRSYYPFGVVQGTAAQKCTRESSGVWTGHLKRARVDYRSCSEGSVAVDYVNNRRDKEAAIGQGVTFHSAVSVKALDTSFGFSTKYDAETFMVYKLDQTKKKHRFCLGGSGKSVASSPALYITYVKPGTPSCDPPGPITCPRSPSRRPATR